MSPSPSFSLSSIDWVNIGYAALSLLGAVAVSVVIVAVLPALGGQWAVLSLVLTPVLHTALLWFKSNDTNSPAKEIIDNLPGKTA